MLQKLRGGLEAFGAFSLAAKSQLHIIPSYKHAASQISSAISRMECVGGGWRRADTESIIFDANWHYTSVF